jgi:integrase
MLGHSSILITEQRYAKTNKEQANRATTAFNKLMEV